MAEEVLGPVLQPVNKTYNTIEPAPSKVRVPRRVLHFSDGIIEEFSTDDEEEKAEDERRKEAERQVVDPKSLTWLPWARYLVWSGAASSLAVADALGEKLAWWLGITSPKYYYEIQEAKRMQEEEEERRKNQDAEMAGWSQEGQEGVVSSQQGIKERH